MPDTSSPPPGPGRARRSNGLPSAEWGALVDLDPRLSENLLASLGAADVAAFVEPAGGEDALSRAAQHPGRPLDRLWVDPLRADAARAVVAGEVADLSRLLAESDPGATAHGFVQAVPRTAAVRVLPPPTLPDPPPRRQPAGSAPAPLPGAADAAGSGTAVDPPSASRPLGDSDDSPAAGPDGDPRADLRSHGPAGVGPGSTDPGSTDPGSTDPRSTESGSADPGSTDADEAWRRIVEGFHLDVEGPVPPWPVSEDLEPPSRRRPAPRPAAPRPVERQDPPPPATSAPTRPGGDAELPGWLEPEALDEDDEHFVPPPPPPVPRLAPQKIAAAAAVIVGFVLMFVPGLLLQPRTAGVAIFGVLVTVAGAAAVVYLMRDAPPDDRGPDDGAVV